MFAYVDEFCVHVTDLSLCRSSSFLLTGYTSPMVPPPKFLILFVSFRSRLLDKPKFTVFICDAEHSTHSVAIQCLSNLTDVTKWQWHKYCRDFQYIQVHECSSSSSHNKSPLWIFLGSVVAWKVKIDIGLHTASSIKSIGLLI